jgi:hypothetical protein
MSIGTSQSHHTARRTPRLNWRGRERERERERHLSAQYLETYRDIDRDPVAGARARVYIAQGYELKIPNPASSIPFREVRTIIVFADSLQRSN